MTGEPLALLLMKEVDWNSPVMDRTPVAASQVQTAVDGVALALDHMPPVETVLVLRHAVVAWTGVQAAHLSVLSTPLLLRWFPMLVSLRSKRTSASGQTSTVETALLRMQLDHDSGALQGEVLKGAFQGWRLADMDRQQLEQFLMYCRTEDANSLQLLDSYLHQRFPGEAAFGGQQQAGPGSVNTMGRSEALAVLGLKDGATEEDIIAAHRKLIQKLHPDRGGNDYLAAQVNLAKDLLLG